MKMFLSLVLSLAAFASADSQSYDYQAPSQPGVGGGNGLGGGNGGRGGSYGGRGANGGGGGEGPFAPAQYSFQYDVNDAASGNNFGHSESREGSRAEGKYYVQLPDTRLMTVEYFADETGYHPTITFEGEAQFPEQSASGQYQQPQAQAQPQQPSSQYQQPPQQQPSAPSQQYGQPFGK